MERRGVDTLADTLAETLVGSVARTTWSPPHGAETSELHPLGTVVLATHPCFPPTECLND